MGVIQAALGRTWGHRRQTRGHIVQGRTWGYACSLWEDLELRTQLRRWTWALSRGPLRPADLFVDAPYF